MKKIEVIPALRALAGKYAELGDNNKAQSYITRAEGLTSLHITNPNNIESLYNKIISVELLLRQRNVDQKKREEAVEVMENAIKLAEELFG